MLRKRIFSTLLSFAIVLMASAVMAATSVSWTSPPEGTTYFEGTVVNPTGQALGIDEQIGNGLDLAIVIDISGSMGWTIYEYSDGSFNTNGTRHIGGVLEIGVSTGKNGLDFAKEAALAMVAGLPDDTTSVAVVGFESTANTTTYQVLTALNPNKVAVETAISDLSFGGGTDIGSGVAQGATELLAGHTSGRSMMQVVLSDGFGSYSGEASTAYADGILTHTVGIPGHSSPQMITIADEGHGVYTDASDLSTLVGLFDGTGGLNLVNLDHVDIELPDGTIIVDIAFDGLGNFILPDWVMALDVNTFVAHAYGDDGTEAIATLNLTGLPGGNPVPEPGTMLLLGTGLSGLVAARRRKAAKKA